MTQVTIPYASPSGTGGEAAWAADLLAMLGAPASSLSDPRIAFLAGQEQVEGNWPGSPNYQLQHNPLSTSMAEPGSWSVNPAGVQGYPTVIEGLQATAATLQQPSDAAYRTALMAPGSSLSELESGLAASTWAGTAPGATRSYATKVFDTASDYHPPSDPGAQGGVQTGVGPLTGPNGLIPSFGLGSGILHDVLIGIAALAGVALIGTGLVLAAKPDQQKGGAADLAKLAAVA